MKKRVSVGRNKGEGRVGRRKRKGRNGVKTINMNHQQNPTAVPSVAVQRPETIHSPDNETVKGEWVQNISMHEFLTDSAHVKDFHYIVICSPLLRRGQYSRKCSV